MNNNNYYYLEINKIEHFGTVENCGGLCGLALSGYPINYKNRTWV